MSVRPSLHLLCPRVTPHRPARVCSGASVDDAVRTCPICRTPTHFVCPSPVWPDTPQLKEEIVGQYVQRLNNIDCKV